MSAGLTFVIRTKPDWRTSSHVVLRRPKTRGSGVLRVPCLLAGFQFPLGDKFHICLKDGGLYRNRNASTIGRLAIVHRAIELTIPMDGFHFHRNQGRPSDLHFDCGGGHEQDIPGRAGIVSRQPKLMRYCSPEPGRYPIVDHLLGYSFVPSRARIFILALCSCDFELPMEQCNFSAIS